MMSEDLNQTAAPLKVIPELSSKPLVADDSPTREEWQFPLWARFKNWVVGFGAAALLILAALYAFYLVQRPAPVEATKPAIAVISAPSPAPAKQVSVKTAIKKKAVQAINTPAVAVISPEIIPSGAPPEPLTPAEQDFANRLAIFESKTP